MCEQGGMYWCAPQELVQREADASANESFAAPSNCDEFTFFDSLQLGAKKRLIAYDCARLEHGLELVANVAATAEDDDIFDGTSDILKARHTHTHTCFLTAMSVVGEVGGTRSLS